MPYAPHHRITMKGRIGAGANPIEEFSMNLSLGDAVPLEPEGGLPVIPRDERLDIVAALASWFSHPDTKISSSASLRSVTFAAIGENGRVITDPVTGEFHQATEGVPDGVVPGGGGANIHPFQISCVLSLHTLRHGPTGKGRIFVPTPTMAVDAAGLVSDGVRDAFLASGRAMVNNVNDASAGHGLVCIASSKGHNSIVDRVLAGRVLDTQRRRRNDLNEEYELLLL